jgi:hypothetical protein
MTSQPTGRKPCEHDDAAIRNLTTVSIVAEVDELGTATAERFGEVVDRFRFYAPTTMTNCSGSELFVNWPNTTATVSSDADRHGEAESLSLRDAC